MAATVINDYNTEKRPLVTFVVTFHNNDSAVLKECIASILNLSLSGIEREIIVVDDGSDFCPMGDLMDYGDEVIYVRKPHQGTGSARNLGINIANGVYLQFVDSNDTLATAEYESCLDVARYKEPDLVMFNYESNKRVGKTVAVIDEKPMAGADFMRNYNIRGTSWGFLFRKDVLHNLRFPNDILNGDEEFTSQLVLRCERIFSLDVVAYHCGEHSEAIANDNDMRWKVRRLDDEETLILRLHRRADTLPYGERQAMQRRLSQLTMDYLYDIIVLTGSKRFLTERLKTLEKEGLFPPREKTFGKRSAMFARMVRTSLGRNILLATLPFFSNTLSPRK